MKKRRFFAIFLILALLISLLAGCAKDDHDRKTEPSTKMQDTEKEPSIVGTWRMILNAGDGEMEGTYDYTFFEDGTGSAHYESIDGDDLRAGVKWLLDDDTLIIEYTFEWEDEPQPLEYFEILMLTDSEMILQARHQYSLVYFVNENYLDYYIASLMQEFGDLTTFLETYSYRLKDDNQMIYIRPNGTVQKCSSTGELEDELFWKVEDDTLIIYDGEGYEERHGTSCDKYEIYVDDLGRFYNTNFIP